MKYLYGLELSDNGGQRGDTRWSVQADATRALEAGSKEVKAALMELFEGHDEQSETKHGANSLLKAMTTLETALMAEFWDRVLQRFNATNKALQSPTLSLNAAVILMKSLCDYVSGLRKRFDEI